MMHGPINITPVNIHFTTKSVFVFSVWFVVSVLLFLSVYNIKELSGKFGLVVSSAELLAVFYTNGP